MMRRAPRSLSSPSPRFHPSHSPSSPSGRYFQRPVPSPPLPTSSLIPRYPSSPPPSPPLAVAAIHRPPSPIAAFHTTTPLEARRPSATKAPTKPPLEVYADGSCFYNGRGSVCDVCFVFFFFKSLSFTFFFLAASYRRSWSVLWP